MPRSSLDIGTCERVRGKNRGTVLIIVLWIVSGLVTVSLYFAHGMFFELRATENTVAGSQAEHAIEGAARYVRFLLTNSTERVSRQEREDALDDALQIDEARAWVIGRSTGTDRGALSTPAFGLIDEASKLNLNTASREMLEGLPRMTPELAAAIIDWRDEDSELTANGAESPYYLLRDPGYDCKNAPFDTVDELRLVAGATQERLYGEDWNLNGVLDPNENDGDQQPPPDNQDGYLDPGILEYVTVYSRRPTATDSGAERVDLSDDPDEGLRDLLETTFGSERAEEIVDRLDGDEDYSSLLAFFSESDMTIDEFDQVASQLSLGEAGNQQAFVNVNTAGEVVLSCIPGIDQQLAEQLVTYRERLEQTPGAIAWITEVLDEQSIDEAGPYLTGESGQYTADIAAVGRMGNGYRRVRFVLDVSSTNNLVLHRQDLGQTGWALGGELRRIVAKQRQMR